MATNRPNSMRHLDDAIRRICNGSMEGYVRTRTIMANAIVASMLPDGVVKGGSAIKMRFGDAATRFTTDLDTATKTDPSLYAQRLSEALADGWEGFSGHVVQKSPASPKDVPNEYVMRPYDVKLTYMGKPWCTVPLEIGHNEIGDATAADWVAPSDAARLFSEIGFPAPSKAPLMSLDHQIAQKLHAVSSGNDRVRDLIDLQLIVKETTVDLASTKRICTRLFSYRRKQAWPPLVEKQPGWNELYEEQSSGLPVIQNIDEAIAWSNALIDKIDHAS